MSDKRKKTQKNPSSDFIDQICSFYNDHYDDREEDTSLGGEDWIPGKKSNHQSLEAFRKELNERYGIKLSTAKIRKILVTGGLWSTERSRKVSELYEKYGSITIVAKELKVSNALVTMYLPYDRVVYDLEDKTGNARRIQRWREKIDNQSEEATTQNRNEEYFDELQSTIIAGDDWRDILWKTIIVHQGECYITCGRGQKPGIEFSYAVSKEGGDSGRKYEGVNFPGFGNEIFIIREGKRNKKSISRSTVDLAMNNALEVMRSEGCVAGPRKLGVPGAWSYLYSMFLRFGVIKQKRSL